MENLIEEVKYLREQNESLKKRNERLLDDLQSRAVWRNLCHAQNLVMLSIAESLTELANSNCENGIHENTLKALMRARNAVEECVDNNEKEGIKTE